MIRLPNFGVPSAAAVPRQQFVDPVNGMFGGPGQDIAQPGLRVDVVQFGGGDQAVHRRGLLSAAVGTGE